MSYNIYLLSGKTIAKQHLLIQSSNRNTRKRSVICLTSTTPEQRCSGAFIINFQHTSHLFQVFIWLTLNK